MDTYPEKYGAARAYLWEASNRISSVVNVYDIDSEVHKAFAEIVNSINEHLNDLEEM